MLVADSNHTFLLENEEQKYLFFFGEFLVKVSHLGKNAQMSTFADNLRLLSVGIEI